LQFSLFGTRTKNPSSRIARDWVRILRAKRPELAQGRRERKYSPKAKFPPGVPSTLKSVLFLYFFELFFDNIFTFWR
jgi:hypothetical protein